MDILYIPQLDDVPLDGGGSSSGSTTAVAARYRLVRRSPEEGRVELADRAVTRMELATDDPVTLVFPPLVRGQVRDFFVRIVITSDEVPQITFTVPDGETFSFEESVSETFHCAVGINVFAFTETDEGVFVVNRKSFTLEHAVSFDGNGGDTPVSEATYALGAAYGTLPKPVLKDHVFLGWFTEPEGGVPVRSTDTAKTSVTRLYAHWEVYVDPYAGVVCTTGNLAFTSEGDALWLVDDEVRYDDAPSVRSGGIGDNQRTSLVALAVGEGTVRFRWRASSEDYYDSLVFLVDGEEWGRISGERDWEYAEYQVYGSGSHTLEWRYEKDGSASSGSDCAWLAGVEWTEGL